MNAGWTRQRNKRTALIDTRNALKTLDPDHPALSPVLSDNNSTSTLQQPQFINSDVTTKVPTSEAFTPAKPKKRHWSKRPIGIFSDTRKRFEAIAKQWGLPEAESVDRLLDLAERALANPIEASYAPPQSTATETPVVPEPTIVATPIQPTFNTEAIASLNEALTTAKTLTEQLIDHHRLNELTAELEVTRSQLAEVEKIKEQQQVRIEALTQDNQNLASQLDAVRVKRSYRDSESPTVSLRWPGKAAEHSHCIKKDATRQNTRQHPTRRRDTLSNS